MREQYCAAGCGTDINFGIDVPTHRLPVDGRLYCVPCHIRMHGWAGDEWTYESCAVCYAEWRKVLDAYEEELDWRREMRKRREGV